MPNPKYPNILHPEDYVSPQNSVDAADQAYRNTGDIWVPDLGVKFHLGRLEWIVQKDVWANETAQKEDGSPDEARMVKKFRRAAAGIDEQLPSDLRPPATLQKTCDYLFDELVGNAQSLATVHHFVWDRTRAVRNDFSIQQIKRPSDVELAIECYERIARFHILSLHQFAVTEKPYDKYDWYQEREQLDRTLLSLMQYYDDNRGRVVLKNEAEFRAYCIIFQIQDPIPDLEERVSCYPEHIRSDGRVKVALGLYAAASNITDAQGPLKPREPHPVAREDWNGFFAKVESTQVSYLMACVAEIYFNMVRKQTLNAVWRSFRRQGNSNDVTDFTLDFLTDLLRFDDPDQTRNFCEHFSFGFKELPDGSDEFLDLHSVSGKTFPEAAQGLGAQMFSQSVVENKRMNRAFSAVIRGYSVSAARAKGLVVEDDDEGLDADMQMDDDSDSLFVPSHDQPASSTIENQKSPFTFGSLPKTSATSPFSSGTGSSVGQGSSSNPFPPGPSHPEKPTASPFAPSAGLQSSIFAPKATASGSPFSSWGKSSSSAWSMPVATTTAPEQAPVDSTPGLSTSIFASAPRPTATSDSAFKPMSGSMHAPPSFAWNKATAPTSSWSTPLTDESSKTSAQTTSTTTPPLGPLSSGESIFSKPNEPQQKLPTFSFGKVSSNAVSEQTPTSPKPDQQQTQTSTPSIPLFNFASSSSKEAEPSTKPLFSFASKSMVEQSEASPITPQASPSLFSFGAQTGGKGTSSNTADTAKSTSIFATPEPVAFPAQSSKPFTFGQSSQSNQDVRSSSEAAQTSSLPGARQDTSPPPQQPPQQQQQSQAGPIMAKSPLSSFTPPNQPKRRSPLSQSHTIEDSPSHTHSNLSPLNFDTPDKPKPVKQAPVPHSAFSVPSTGQPALQQPVKPDLSTILNKVADEMVTDPERGLLRQFVEYHTRPVILSVYEELYVEEMRAIAANFRREKLAKRYGRRWRETAWRLRLARQGREKREKRRNARRERITSETGQKRKFEEDAVDNFLKRRSVQIKQDSANGVSTNHGVSTSNRHASLTSDTAIHEDTTTDAVEDDLPAEQAQDRQETTTSPSPADAPGSSHRQSHYLGFSLPKQRHLLAQGTPRKSSQSAYFRMKALGLNPSASTATVSMGPPSLNIKKRARDEDSESVDAWPPQKKSRTPPRENDGYGLSRFRRSSSASQSSILQLSPAPTSAVSSVIARAQPLDDDVISRARAARESMRQSTRPWSAAGRESVNGTSVVANALVASTSLERARMQARMRAVERAESALARSARLDVPAYRMRESRFVPREHYGRAIERAQETIERRSRAGSVASAVDHSGTSPAEGAFQMGTEGSSSSPRLEASHDTQAEGIAPIPSTQTFSLHGDHSEVFEEPSHPDPISEEETNIKQFVTDVRSARDTEQDELSNNVDSSARDTTMADDMSPEPFTFPSQAIGASSSYGLGPDLDAQNLATSSYLHLDGPQPDASLSDLPPYPELYRSFEVHPDDRVQYPSLPDVANEVIPYVPQPEDDEAHVEADSFRSVADEQQLDNRNLGNSTHDDEHHSQSPIQVDPSLIDMHVEPATQAPAIHVTEKSSSPPKLNLISQNPFAALADEGEDDQQVASSSSPAEEKEDQPVLFRQPDDDHFVTNGIIQDKLRSGNELQTASVVQSSVGPHAAAPIISDGPARHTRSRSRELSQMLSPVLDNKVTKMPRYSLRSSPIREEAEEQQVGQRLLSPEVDDISAAALPHSSNQVPIERDASAERKTSATSEISNNRIANDVERVDTDMSTQHADAGEEAEVSSGSEGVDDPNSRSDEEHIHAQHRPSQDVTANRTHLDESEAGSDESEDESAEEESESAVDAEEELAYGDQDAEDESAGRSAVEEEGEVDEDDEDEEELDEEEEEELSYDEDDDDEDDDEDEDDEHDRYGLTPDQMQQSGIVKGGTGVTAEDAFELSD